jgi:hypothetical protein
MTVASSIRVVDDGSYWLHGAPRREYREDVFPPKIILGKQHLWNVNTCGILLAGRTWNPPGAYSTIDPATTNRSLQSSEISGIVLNPRIERARDRD